MTNGNSAEGFPGNPEHMLPPEIVELLVRHWGFDDQLHDGIIEVHQDLAEDVQAFFTEALRRGFPIETVQRTFNRPDGDLMAGNVTSGYNDRTIAGTEYKSQHALGRAFDVNTRLNPYVREGRNGERIVEPEGAAWDPNASGTLHGNHPLVLLMEARGWTWGGRWDPPDYQHFQKPGSISPEPL